MSAASEHLLNEPEHQLLSLARRQYVLEGFLAELNRVTRGKEFRVWNGVVWIMLLDMRDMLVIHLASWAKSIYERGGLIGQLQAHHSQDLRRTRTCGHPNEKDDDYFFRSNERAHSEAFDRLFSSACADCPKQIDFDLLRNAFVERMSVVVDDRHNNRAHPYEGGKQIGAAAMLTIEQLRDALTFAERFMNDVRLVGCGSTFGYGDVNDVDTETVAQELVDAVLLGTAPRIEIVRGAVARDVFYDDLHQKHDARTDSHTVLFNDNWPDG